MHMADALVSPAVGGVMGAAAAALLAWSAREVRRTAPGSQVPLMGVLGAFVFTAQMINFAIPFTGSSGHLGGGLLLAVLLGSHAAFLVLASVLLAQALFFLDGGLLAFGCNLVNLGFFPAFLAWPLVYRPIAGDGRRPFRNALAAVAAAVAGLQFGAFAVVVQTRLSGISDLSFGKLILLMQPIHLAIGIVEGLITAGVLSLVARARPEALAAAGPPAAPSPRVLAGLLAASVLAGGVLSGFASSSPDGLEWALARAFRGESKIGTSSRAHEVAGAVQERTAVLPDYSLPGAGPGAERAGASLSGLVGGAVTLVLAGAAGWALRPGRSAA